MNTRRFPFLIFSLLLSIISLSGTCKAQTHIEIRTPMTPPNWALLEQELLKASSEALEKYYAAFFDERGYYLHVMRWGTLDGPDDVIETFRNFTLLHALGTSDSVLDLFKKGLEGHLRQYTEFKTDSTEVAKHGAYYKEMMPMLDWHHRGEGMQGLYNQGLSDPTDIKFQKRMRRFAGFYMNKDPDAPNYDPEHKIIRSIWNGSRGPMLRRATMYDWVGDPVDVTMALAHSADGRYVLQNLMDKWPEMLMHCAEYLHSAGDHPLNLLATILPMNAYMLAHEEKYKNWIVEYVDAWKERIEKNGGNIPSNIGLDGTIGGETDGKWYGGTYGWDFSPWSPEFKVVAYRNMFAKGMWPGFGNALLVTGDQKYVDVLRRQMDNLYAQKKVVKGRVMIPQNYGEKGLKTEPPIFKMVNGELYWEEKILTEPGWYNWTRDLMIPQLTDIYLWSMDRKDLERIPVEGWIAFLEGKNPDYPEQALQDAFSYIRNQMEIVRNDPTTPDTRCANLAYVLNPAEIPVITLYELMLGCHLYPRIFIPHARVRYFDPERKRAGIPEDVGALVTEMNKDMTKVTLVNINQVEPRDVIVQTGAFGEHQCVRVETGGKVFPVNNRFFHVHLAPGAGAELIIYAQRYSNPPTLAFPWHGDRVPLP